MDPSSPADPMHAKVDSLVRDGTLTPDQADRVYQRVRDSGAGATSVASVDRDHRQWTLPLRGMGAAVVVGAAVLLAGLLVVDGLADKPDFNWKAFVVLLVGTVALCVVGAAAAIFGDKPDHGRWVGSVLLASGILAAALVVHILLRDQDWSNYVAGAVMLLAGAAAYFWVRGAALTAVVVAGGLLVLTQLISDVLDEGSDSVLGPGIAITVYGLVVIAAGWRFATCHTTGLLGGIIAVSGMLLVVYVGSVVGVASAVVSPPTRAGAGGGGASDFGVPDINGDLWTALIIGLLVCAGLAGLYAYSDYVGYLVVAFVGAALLTLSTLALLQTDNRLWLAVTFCAVGGVLLAAAVLRELLAGDGGLRRVTTRGGGGPPVSDAYGQGYGQQGYGQPGGGPGGQYPPPPGGSSYPQPPPPSGPPAPPG